MREIAIISIAVAVLGVACAGYYLLTSEERPPEEVEYETYINENYSFEFDYPANWIFREQKNPWFGISYFDAVENVPENEIGGAFSLAVMEPGSWENEIGPSLDNVRSEITSQIENNENYIMLSGPTDTVIGNTIAFKCSVSIFDPTENTTIQVGLTYAAKDNYLYNLSTFSKKEDYSDYEPIFEHVIGSFSFPEN
jgi:hypothetical protein